MWSCRQNGIHAILLFLLILFLILIFLIILLAFLRRTSAEKVETPFHIMAAVPLISGRINLHPYSSNQEA